MSLTETNEAPKRGPGRPPLHTDDPRARAKSRSQELLDQMGSIDDTTDIFYIPASAIPDGWSYQWKRYSTHNQIDSEHISECKRHGWEFVPAKRHPEMVAIGSEKDEWIFRRGMVLMEIPLEVEDVYRARDRKDAKNQVTIKEQQALKEQIGPFDRDNVGKMGQSGAQVNFTKKSWSPMKVPD